MELQKEVAKLIKTYGVTSVVQACAKHMQTLSRSDEGTEAHQLRAIMLKGLVSTLLDLQDFPQGD